MSAVKSLFGAQKNDEHGEKIKSLLDAASNGEEREIIKLLDDGLDVNVKDKYSVSTARLLFFCLLSMQFLFVSGHNGSYAC